MKQHPYLVVFLLGWVLALPAVFIRYPEFGLLAKVLAGSLRGSFPMLAGWTTVYLNRHKEPQTRLERAAMAVTFASIVFLVLAVWASSQGHSA